ncbi:MAG: hypothetical protein ABH844_02035 [Candidatus Omnitrophota bacterium]
MARNIMTNIFKPSKPRRIKGYDYSKDGYYYVTVCTYNHGEIFGIVENETMVLNQYGNIAKKSWLDLPKHHKNIHLNEFIIMSSHIPGIVIIDNPVVDRPAWHFYDAGKIL